MKYLIREVLNLETEEFISSADFFARPEHQIIQDRRKLEECFQQGRKWLICPLCHQPLKIRGLPLVKDRKKGLHFWHITHHQNCPYNDYASLSKRDIERLKFHGQQEGELHHRLKDIIAKSLACDPLASDIQTERIFHHKTKPKRWKRPDVFAIFDNHDIVFEIQLATTFLSVIVEREVFYGENSVFIMWVFHQFLPNEDLQRLTEKDVIHANKINAFVVNEDTLKRSQEEQKFILYCYYQKPSIRMNDGTIENSWELEEIAFRDLHFDTTNHKLYFFDYDKCYNELITQLKWKLPESTWRTQWKDRFPQKWQNFPIQDPETQAHFFPDIKTSQGRTFQFVHANLPEKLIVQWEKIIPQITWVVYNPLKSFQKVKDVKKRAINAIYSQKLDVSRREPIKISLQGTEEIDQKISLFSDKIAQEREVLVEQQEELEQQTTFLRSLLATSVSATPSSLWQKFEQYFTTFLRLQSEPFGFSSDTYISIRNIFRQHYDLVSAIHALYQECSSIKGHSAFAETLRDFQQGKWPLNAFRELPKNYLTTFSRFWKDIFFIKTWEKSNIKKLQKASTEKEFTQIVKEEQYYDFYIKDSIISSLAERYSGEREKQLQQRIEEHKLTLWEKVKEEDLKQRTLAQREKIQLTQENISTIQARIQKIENSIKNFRERLETLIAQQRELQQQRESQKRFLEQRKQRQILLLQKEWEQQLTEVEEKYPQEIVYPKIFSETWKKRLSAVYFDIGTAELLHVTIKDGEICLSPVKMERFMAQILG